MKQFADSVGDIFESVIKLKAVNKITLLAAPDSSPAMFMKLIILPIALLHR